ncbi:CPBP family intramembrane glutamic endopeptidase [Marinigracilibium pacificum]|uniref:CPBP family intramembrane metalloprotease n=1 Tax=Marinigracilibium pacificum TaxID=2729599 RepID=A0A848IZI8_9BACT|nr:type II CAAX endopeptidase family protein [Marinigracilibium pacificum]NMM47710.1 CPBP family intramembrane metalloprotease [Marinigracilibium pacificum]
MLGIFFGLILSWAILYLFERKSILSLGFTPVSKRLLQFITGFFISFTLCAIVQIIEISLRNQDILIADSSNLGNLSSMAFWDLKSVVTEELIFRGAILLVIIERFGKNAGIALSAISFGVYHWFSYGIIGNVIPMIVIFIGTALMGLAWALAFYKSKSILLPIGLHFGWNFTLNTIFSKGPLGEGVILTKGGTEINDLYSLVGLWLAPLVIFLIINFLIPNENINKSAGIPHSKTNII